jgi:hypothetical protein
MSVETIGPNNGVFIGALSGSVVGWGKEATAKEVR